MIGPAPGVRVWLAAGSPDLRRGFDGLSRLVQLTSARLSLLLEEIDWRMPEGTARPVLLTDLLARPIEGWPPARIDDRRTRAVAPGSHAADLSRRPSA